MGQLESRLNRCRESDCIINIPRLSCCFNGLLTDVENSSIDKKFVSIEQKLTDVEHKFINCDENNERLNNKYTLLEEKYNILDKQYQQLYGEIKMLKENQNKMERILSNIELDHSEILENNIIIMDE